jgi:hypothetical protein
LHVPDDFHEWFAVTVLLLSLLSITVGDGQSTERVLGRGFFRG